MSASPREAAVADGCLVVLSHDTALADTVQAIGSEHRVIGIGSEADLVAQVSSGRAGVVILDAAAVATPIERLTERLKNQFSDLVLIVAGGIDDQSALAAQITNGTVYRFLHKPVSEQRVKLFVDAAWRRHDEQADFDVAAPQAAARGDRPAPRNGLLVGAAAILAAVVAGMWLMRGKPAAQRAPSPVTAAAPEVQQEAPGGRDEAFEDLLARGDRALTAGALVAPPAENAAQLYSEALQRKPSDPRASAGLEKVIGKLLSNAEEQLVAQHLDQAQRLTDAARAIKPDHVRVAFLTAEIGKERERAVIAQARQAASSGNIGQAISVLDGGGRSSSRSSAAAAPNKQELEKKQLADRVQDLLGKASEAMARGAFVEPVQNNAHFYLESARALAPGNKDVVQLERTLQERIVSEARKALAAGNADQADRWIQAAADSGVSREDTTSLTREAQRVRAAAKTDALARLALLFNQRLAQGRILDPASDSAKSYLAQLIQADPNSPSTQLSRQTFSVRMVTEARGAVTRQDYASAKRWLQEAHDAGADLGSINAVQADMQAAQEAAQRENEVVTASSLQLTHYVPPDFPQVARERSLSGWVDVQFVIRTDGTVSDVNIIGAEPVGVFEQAATDAVRKWRYHPIVRNGQTIDQRARLRLRFALTQ